MTSPAHTHLETVSNETLETYVDCCHGDADVALGLLQAVLACQGDKPALHAWCRLADHQMGIAAL